MFDLSEISSFKKKADNNYEKQGSNYDSEFNAGMQFLRDFAKNPTDITLRLAATKFSNAIKCKRASIEPYCYLSYIFYIFDKKETSIEYFRYAESIDQRFHLLPELRAMLYSN